MVNIRQRWRVVRQFIGTTPTGAEIQYADIGVGLGGKKIIFGGKLWAADAQPLRQA